ELRYPVPEKPELRCRVPEKPELRCRVPVAVSFLVLPVPGTAVLVFLVPGTAVLVLTGSRVSMCFADSHFRLLDLHRHVSNPEQSHGIVHVLQNVLLSRCIADNCVRA